MKKRYFWIVGVLAILCLFVLLFRACSYYHSESLNLKFCGAYAVPGMFCQDLKGPFSTVKVVETDDRGRILFRYTATHNVTGQEETALVICQKIDWKYVYFYEDRCWMFETDSGKTVAELKAQNDWGKKPDSNKMSRREHRSTADLYIITEGQIDYNEAYQACRDHFGVSSYEDPLLFFCDTDGKNLDLMYFRYKEYSPGVDSDRLERTVERHYLVLINGDGIVYELPLSGGTITAIDPEELAAFKTAHGWNYH